VARPPHVPQPETELEEFFDLSIDPPSIIGFDGEFKRVNASFVRLLGYPKPELLSRSALEILHPDDVEPAREALAQLAEGHDLVRFEARVICAGGAVRWRSSGTRGRCPSGASCTASDGTQPASHLLNCDDKNANCGSLTSAFHPSKPLVCQVFRGLSSAWPHD
jgi:PAS domain S-box-containing protein